MWTRRPLPARRRVEPLGIEELEAGLRVMEDGDTDLSAFWDNNIDAFRQTVLLAIRETSDALMSPAMTLRWRVEMQSQLEDLVRYIELADRYIERRSRLSSTAVRRRSPFVPRVVH